MAIFTSLIYKMVNRAETPREWISHNLCAGVLKFFGHVAVKPTDHASGTAAIPILEWDDFEFAVLHAKVATTTGNLALRAGIRALF